MTKGQIAAIVSLLAFGGFVIAIVVISAQPQWFFGDPLLDKCEDAIKAKLKAPSSYRRIKVEGSGGYYKIEYDAVNSFNAPLRARGTCFTKPDGGADWFEDQPDSTSSDTMTAPLP